MAKLSGPGWQQQLLMAVGLLGAFIAGLKLLAAAADRHEKQVPPDALLVPWHRYEEGDLTRQEFERAKRALRVWPSGARAARRTRTEVYDVAS